MSFRSLGMLAALLAGLGATSLGLGCSRPIEEAPRPSPSRSEPAPPRRASTPAPPGHGPSLRFEDQAARAGLGVPHFDAADGRILL
jgi:hypothetical protein